MECNSEGSRDRAVERRKGSGPAILRFSAIADFLRRKFGLVVNRRTARPGTNWFFVSFLCALSSNGSAMLMRGKSLTCRCRLTPNLRVSDPANSFAAGSCCGQRPLELKGRVRQVRDLPRISMAKPSRTELHSTTAPIASETCRASAWPSHRPRICPSGLNESLRPPDSTHKDAGAGWSITCQNRER
jgi:hypothetical protein